MRVTRERAAANRQKILDAAGTLFRQHGFDGIGVADIMKRAGLTHGGFYGHFPSKDQLAAETCASVPGNDSWIEKVAGSARPTFAALGSDVVRQPRTVRRAFTEGLRSRVDGLGKLLQGRSAAARREKALATMAGLVGALMLARAVDDSKLSDEILKAGAATFGRS